MTNKAEWQNKQESTSNFGLKLIIFCYRIFGRSFTLAIIWCISFTIFIFNKNIRYISRDYLLRIRSFAKSKNVLLPANGIIRHIYCFCSSLFDRILDWQGFVSKDDLISVNNALDILKRAELEERGALIVGAHIGSLDVLRAINSFKPKKIINILIIVSNSKRIVNFMSAINPNSSLNFIIADEITPATAIDLAQRVARNEWVVILGDRLLNSDTRSVEANFLGGKANFPQGPWILAHMLKVPVYTMFALRVGSKHKLILNEWGICSLPRKDRDKQLQLYVDKYAAELEQVLLVSPCEWFNFYSFWQEKNR